MPDSIFAKFQPVSQRIVSDPAHRALRHRVDPVLFLLHAACIQSVEFDGLEAIRNLRTSLSSRLRLRGGSVGCDPILVGWSLTLQLSSFQNQVRPECAVLVEFLRDKYPLCNNESDASARARFVCKLLISRHCYNSRTS
jgi:hypothetical protein